MWLKESRLTLVSVGLSSHTLTPETEVCPMNTKVHSSKQLLYQCPMGLELSGKYFDYRIMTQIYWSECETQTLGKI